MVLYHCLRHAVFLKHEKAKREHVCRAQEACVIVAIPSLTGLATSAHDEALELALPAVQEFGYFLECMASFTAAKIDRKLLSRGHDKTKL